MLSLCRACEVACNNTLVTGPVFSVCAVRGREDAEIEPVPDVIGPVERPGPVDIEPVERPDPNAAPAVAVPVRGE